MAEPNRIAAALEYLDKLRRQIANTQGVAVPDDYGQRFGAPGEPVPSLNQVGQLVRGAAQRMTSLDAPASQGMGDTALDIAAGFTPLQYPQAARDFERSRRTGDKLGMGLATLAAVPVVGGVAKAAGEARGLEKAIKNLETSALEDSQIFSKPLPNADANDLDYLGKVGASPLGRGGMHISVRGSVKEAGPHEFFFHNDNDEPIGFARMTKGPKEASINMIALTEENRGQGLGKSFYRYLLDDLGVAVKSDKEITPNTADLYRSLAREYPIRIDADGRIVISPKVK